MLSAVPTSAADSPGSLCPQSHAKQWEFSSFFLHRLSLSPHRLCRPSAHGIPTSGSNPCLWLGAAVVAHRNGSPLARSHSKGNKMSFCHGPSLAPEGLSLPELSPDYLRVFQNSDLLLRLLPISWSRRGRPMSPSSVKACHTNSAGWHTQYKYSYFPFFRQCIVLNPVLGLHSNLSL